MGCAAEVSARVALSIKFVPVRLLDIKIKRHSP